MARAVRTISVNLSAGTAKFMSDLDKASGKLKEFGREGVSNVQATSGALRVLEGNMTNNLRAAERFVANVLGLGPILKAAFPVVGAVALGGVLSELGEKAYNFYKSIRDAGEKAEGTFRGLAAPIRLTNDELRVSNDRLANEIAKLEGRHENTLKLALDEARVAADKLAESLDKDLANLHKILDEQKVGFFRQLLGEAGTKDISKELGGETGFGGFRARIADITEQGNAKIAAATDLKAKDAAQTELQTRLTKAYADELTRVSKLTEEAQQKAAAKPRPDIISIGPGAAVAGVVPGAQVPGQDEKARLEMLTAVRRQLQFEQAGIGLQSTNTNLTAKKDSLEAARAGAQQERPFEDRMKAIGAEIEGLQAKLKAIGQPEAAQVLAKAFGEARKQIEEVNKGIERQIVLNAEQKREAAAGQIIGATPAESAQRMARLMLEEQTKASTEAEITWQTKFSAATVSITDRIKSQELLTAAIGKGYDATRQANVESRLMQELGAHFNDPAWMQGHQPEVQSLRSGFTREFDTQHAEQSAQATQMLREQIELERELARVQAQGAAAVREATLAVKVRQMELVGATREQIQAEKDLFAAKEQNNASSEVAKIEERILATQRLTAAIAGGAAAERQAALENRIAEIRRQGTHRSQV